MVLLLAPGVASAASPVLEFVVPGHSLPIPFTTESGAVNAEMAGFSSLVNCAASHGEGEITGPRSTVSKYRFTGCVTQRGSHEKCKSVGAQQEEITTGPIEADLVWISQAKDEVGMVLDPSGGPYIAFECGGESAEGAGPFLAPVAPLDQETTSFTATLSQSNSMQTPDEYEGEKGELLQAIPMGRHGTHPLVTTGVELTMTIHPGSPGEIRAGSAPESSQRPKIEGQAALGHQLTCTNGSWEGFPSPTFSYKWLRNGVEISGAGQGNTYTVQASDQGSTITCEVSASNSIGKGAAVSAGVQIPAAATSSAEEEANNKKHQEEASLAAAAKERQEKEAAAAKKTREQAGGKAKSPTRAQLLAKALRLCKKDKSKNARTRCKTKAEKKYGGKTNQKLSIPHTVRRR